MVKTSEWLSKLSLVIRVVGSTRTLSLPAGKQRTAQRLWGRTAVGSRRLHNLLSMI